MSFLKSIHRDVFLVILIALLMGVLVGALFVLMLP